ncbi:unnamed protein product [Rodentolepis nana]|uniref:Secreted protein n=1 Tax=Rodentolepis nana TaxID=102285 RepID=A0A0R3TJ73_RODNA|nr:unnamed protein product [Rodentolepis nana]
MPANWVEVPVVRLWMASTSKLDYVFLLVLYPTSRSFVEWLSHWTVFHSRPIDFNGRPLSLCHHQQNEF